MVQDAVHTAVQIAQSLTKTTRERASAAAHALLGKTGLDDVAHGAQDRVGKVADEILAAGRANGQLINTFVGHEVDQAVDRLGLARRSDLDDLTTEIAGLRAAVASLTVQLEQAAAGGPRTGSTRASATKKAPTRKAPSAKAATTAPAKEAAAERTAERSTSPIETGPDLPPVVQTDPVDVDSAADVIETGTVVGPFDPEPIEVREHSSAPAADDLNPGGDLAGGPDDGASDAAGGDDDRADTYPVDGDGPHQ